MRNNYSLAYIFEFLLNSQDLKCSFSSSGIVGTKTGSQSGFLPNSKYQKVFYILHNKGFCSVTEVLVNTSR